MDAIPRKRPRRESNDNATGWTRLTPGTWKTEGGRRRPTGLPTDPDRPINGRTTDRAATTGEDDRRGRPATTTKTLLTTEPNLTQPNPTQQPSRRAQNIHSQMGVKQVYTAPGPGLHRTATNQTNVRIEPTKRKALIPLAAFFVLPHQCSLVGVDHDLASRVRDALPLHGRSPLSQVLVPELVAVFGFQ